MAQSKHVIRPIPVFLPGNERKFEEMQGVAEITPEGEIKITLQSKAVALALYKQFEENVLFAVGFDYKPAKEKT